MEIISPVPYNWLLEDTKSGVVGGEWTAAENKQFENALAVYDKETPDRWHNVAAMIPGKSVGDVIRKYKELEDDVSNIEAGITPDPGYPAATFTLDWVAAGGHPKRSKPLDQERKKGVPWTEEEHKLFLMGLKKYGKGDWRNISRNFVVTRTPTQVASHAQKYFIRQLSGGKDKRRASIHDITTVNLSDPRTPSPESRTPSSPPPPPQQSSSAAAAPFQWNQPTGAQMGFHVGSGNVFNVSSSPYGIPSFGMKMQGHSGNNTAGGNTRDSYFGAQSMVFQMQSAQSYPRG